MINKHIIICFFLLFSTVIIAQSNSLSGSPYSLYGLGQINKTSTGKINGLGKSGIAMTSNTFINNSNPASFGSRPLERFYFDFGFKAETNLVTENGRKDSNTIANFSNISIAFPVSKKSGLGITLIPFSSVGYTIDDIKTNIEGSIYSYYTDIEGKGGINNFKLDYGYSLNNKLRLGLTGSVLFGQITQTETNNIPIIANNAVSISVLRLYDENYYSGVRLGSGIQYDVSNKLSIGAIVNLPAILNGDKKRTAQSSTQSLEVSNGKIADFELPLEIGFGFQSKIKEHFTFNLDYKKNFWNSTDQSDQLGNYVDQDFVGLGLEYAPKNKNPSFFNSLEYRAGFNYDNGNLEVNKQRVKNQDINFGIGIPLNNYSNSMINIAYSYGNKGQVTNGLVRENYHLFSINLSLEAIWFQKAKYQ
jgi:Outer membrane protein beta-barrel domain